MIVKIKIWLIIKLYIYIYNILGDGNWGRIVNMKKFPNSKFYIYYCYIYIFYFYIEKKRVGTLFYGRFLLSLANQRTEISSQHILLFRWFLCSASLRSFPSSWKSQPLFHQIWIEFPFSPPRTYLSPPLCWSDHKNPILLIFPTLIS